ncbi:LysR substrate-binding domain-containing protein [Azotobacter beijerinckii]|uniref:DNA-binding transcriptional regulator, LysR family n=1 Tax=Azotobacter beijerinckii TaxID=170623 RepID=A0A1I4BMZ4_9GAMM|nr:LysR substrate-binding domain-containing protein [Azotobacter beijerinckii]SFB11235.1 DNA-binding transcriptional regulator, LysR family [Azotobacter beijerinckii]SFK69923.1 DNA-binding transcriptional regulator, LysR family [Azotobacter beijerinckii]
MNDLNDLLYFVSVVRHNGFTAAARATSIEKSRLSRRVAELEKRLGVRLLQRSTRSISLTEAGEQFYERCVATVEEAEAAYDSVANLRKEPVGTVRVSCPLILAQTYLAPILPAYMASHPKVKLVIEATDREVNLIDERFDLALCARPQIGSSAGLVAKNLGIAQRILVAGRDYLGSKGTPTIPADLPNFDTLGRSADIYDGSARWDLIDRSGTRLEVNHSPRLISNDLRLQLEAAVGGIGIALLPEPIVAATIRARLLERVLPEWSATANIIHLLYPSPRGMLPSVRSVIDYFMIHLPIGIQERSVVADAFRILS